MTFRPRSAYSLRMGLALAAVLSAVPPLAAQQPAPAPAPAAAPTPATPPGETVVARVNGEAITLADLSAAARDLPEELRGAPPQMLYPLLLDQLIAGKAIIAAARSAGLDRDPAVQARIRRAEEQELQQAWLTNEIASRITDEAIRARYDQQIANRQAEEEVHARHILVPTESEAREALAEIRGGADFSAVAQRRSTGPGTREGGDLGFFKRGDMVPEFAEAAFALQPGQISEPVRSPFGWHIIKVEERRRATPPSFEDAAPAIRQQLLQAEVQAAVERARSAVTVERLNLDGSAPRATDSAEPPPPAAPPASRPAAPTRR